MDGKHGGKSKEEITSLKSLQSAVGRRIRRGREQKGG